MAQQKTFLQHNIEGILAGKSKDWRSRYKTLYIQNVEALMEGIAVHGYGYKTRLEYHELNHPNMPTYRQTLRDDVRSALQDNPDKYRIFDYVLIDEIQDFDDDQLYLIRQVARTDNFFFVGDIGQKIYDRYHDLKRHGFVIDTLDLPKTYKMYRTPRLIGQLAYSFIMSDAAIRSEFEEHGYRQDTQFQSHNNNAAELLRAPDPISEGVDWIQRLLASHYVATDIMVITSEQLLPAYKTAFEQADISFSIGESLDGQVEQVCLVDFMNVKGLERWF